MDQDDQKPSKPVPRFGSFRPHALPTLSKPGGTGRTDRNSSSGLQDSISKRHRHSSKRPSHSLKPRPDSGTSSNPEHDLVPWDDSPVLFDIDVNGDARNIEYKSSYGGPVYRQSWHDRALGLKSFGGSGVHRASEVDRGKTSLSKQIRSDLKTTKTLRVRPRPSSGLHDDAGADFVPLQPLKGRKRKLENCTIIRSSPQSPRSRRYESLDDASDSASAPDAILENASDQSTLEDDGGHTPKLLEDLQRKRAALSNRVDEAPSDWHAWMALVELQDDMDGFPNAFSDRPHTIAERQSNAEIALSMYSKALKCVIDPEGRERLHLSMMSKASIVWETRKMSLHWQTIVKQHPLSLRVWNEYFNFHQSLSSGFTVEENKKRYIDCIHVLQDVRNDMASSDARQSAAYGIQIHVLLRLTLLLREAGYTEVAVASWQALIEFEFNKPPQFKSLGRTAKPRVDDSILAFEHFWDSEVPRIGEPNAKGWLNFDDADLEENQPPKIKGVVPSHSGTNVFRTWADAEYQAYCSSKLPSRVIDEPLDDPYKTVLFSDVSHALIEPPTDSDNHAIVAAFLCFCHLPPCPDNSKGQIQTWYEDQFIRNEVLYDRRVISSSHSREVADSYNPQGNGSTTIVKTVDPSLPEVFAFHLGNYEISSDTLFTPSDQWFSAFSSRTGPVPEDFILRTLERLVSRGIGGDSLAEYLLAFEEHVSPTTVRRSAKNLLKNRPSSLRLYDAYALLESRHGNTETANKVRDTAIKMSAKFEDSARRDAILLWRSRIWQHLSLGETSKALQQLSRYGSENNVDATSDTNGKLSDEATTTVRLRLRNALSAGRDHMLSIGSMTHAALYAELLFLSDYLLNTSNQAAHASFASNLEILTQNKNPNTNRRAEALFRQSFARLLYTHTTHKRPISPATIRSFLTESIAAFPHNTIFLSLHAWNESRFRIDDRVRGIIRDVVFSNKNKNKNETQNLLPSSDHITTHFFAIHTDIHRGPLQGSNRSAVRGTFERALASTAAPHSAALWKWYFLYELELELEHNGDGNRRRAREVYHRAVRACPWAKGVYMLAFEYLSVAGGMEEGELRGVYEMMGERELRVHVAL
ncbi:MAG: hypothetical protein L6R36_001797 [Xanthoria steineri]|nr:MAG: hypothetical protein L6R36_001797 [Xanthoria steineri]